MTSAVDIRHSKFDLRRVGCVPYLNSKPLIYGIEDQIRLETPAVLAQILRAGQLDCALSPIVEFFEQPGYQILPSISIASRGPVRSVVLAYRGPISALRTVELDPSSRTSSLLVQVILGEFFGLDVVYRQALETRSQNDARLWIGDPALLERQRFQSEDWNLLDLGEAWFDATELPFVFACWLVREGVDAAPYLEILARARDEGLANLETIIRNEKRMPEKMVRSYFRDAVRYELGAAEIKGILEFQRLLKKRGLIAQEVELKVAA